MGLEQDNWEDRSACREAGDPDAFFWRLNDIEGTLPQRRELLDQKVAYAKSFCTRCPVRTECLKQAFNSGEVQGIAGGLTEREQRALFKKVRKTSRPGARDSLVA